MGMDLLTSCLSELGSCFGERFAVDILQTCNYISPLLAIVIPSSRAGQSCASGPATMATLGNLPVMVCNAIMAEGMAHLAGLIEGGLSHRDAVAKMFKD